MAKRITLFFIPFLITIYAVLPQEKKPVILSEHFESSGDFIIYSNNVEFISETYKIFADYLKYNTKTKDIIAEGRVTMTSGEMSVSGSGLSFNAEEMKGEMIDVQGMLEPSVSFSADRLVNENKDIQRFSKMKFTSCTQLNPRWSISSVKGKIRRDKYIEMKDAVLRIKSIPVLYLPYLRYPIQDGKSTGFLFPVLGNSDKFGFFMKNSFFWNIKPNFDVNFSYDHISKIGKGAEIEMRYLLRNSEGDIKFYYFDYSDAYKESLEEGTVIDDRDFNLSFNHLQKMDFLNTRIRADVNYQSNPEFQSVFNKDYGRYNSSRFNSVVSLTSSLSNLSLSVMASRNETFYIQRNTSNVITKLPSISLNLKQQKIPKIPGYFTFRGMFESVNRSGIDYEEIAAFTSDVTSDRFSLAPSYTLNILKLPWLSATTEFTSKHSYYLKTQDPKTKEVLDEPLHLNYNSVDVTVKGPSFSRIYDSRFSRIKHVIEPEIKVFLSTSVDESERQKVIPIDLFDYPSYSFVSFSLNSRIYVKKNAGNKPPREVFTYTLSQKYYFDPEVANRFRTIDLGDEKIYPEFSEMTNSFRFRPVKDISLDLSIDYNFYLESFQRVNFTAAYSNADSPVKGSVTYSRFYNPFRPKDFFLNIELIRTDLDIRLPLIPVRINAAVDYDIALDRFRYGSIIASYDYQCINFNAEMKIYTMIDGTTDYTLTFGVTFGNLGMVKDFFSSGGKQ